MNFNETIKTLALISLYSTPDYELLCESYNTLYLCTHQGNEALMVVEVFAIQAVIAMVPHKLPNHPELCFFLVENLVLMLLNSQAILMKMRMEMMMRYKFTF
jgi:hypothetical protein